MGLMTLDIKEKQYELEDTIAITKIIETIQNTGKDNFKHAQNVRYL